MEEHWKLKIILPEVYNDDSQVAGFEQLTTAMQAENKVTAIGRDSEGRAKKKKKTMID